MIPQSKSGSRSAPSTVGNEQIEDQLRRLMAVNEELQTQLAEHLTLESDWERDRTLFRALLDQVPDYLFVKDRESRFVIANRAVAADLGFTPDGLIGKTDFDLHHRIVMVDVGFAADRIRAEIRDHRIEAFAIAAGYRNPLALAHENPGGREPDAARSAGDERNLSLETPAMPATHFLFLKRKRLRDN